MDYRLTQQDEEFRKEFKDWLKKTFPKEETPPKLETIEERCLIAMAGVPEEKNIPDPPFFQRRTDPVHTVAGCGNRELGVITGKINLLRIFRIREPVARPKHHDQIIFSCLGQP